MTRKWDSGRDLMAYTALAVVLVCVIVAAALWPGDRADVPTSPPAPEAAEDLGAEATPPPSEPTATPTEDSGDAVPSAEDPATRRVAAQLGVLLSVYPDRCVLRCDVEGALPDTTSETPTILRDIVMEDGHDYGGAVPQVIDGELVVAVPPGSGTGELWMMGFAHGRIGWEDCRAGGVGDCAFIEISEHYTGLYGTAVGEPLEGAYVHGCGGKAAIEDDGSFFMTTRTAPCEAFIVVLHEGLLAFGPAVELDPVAGTDLTIELRYPDERDLRPRTPEEMEGLYERLESSERICGRKTTPDEREDCVETLVEPVRERIRMSEEQVELWAEDGG